VLLLLEYFLKILPVSAPKLDFIRTWPDSGNGYDVYKNRLDGKSGTVSNNNFKRSKWGVLR